MPVFTDYSLEGKGRQTKQMPPPTDITDLERNKFSSVSSTLLNLTLLLLLSALNNPKSLVFSFSIASLLTEAFRFGSEMILMEQLLHF